MKMIKKKKNRYVVFSQFNKNAVAELKKQAAQLSLDQDSLQEKLHLEAESTRTMKEIPSQTIQETHCHYDTMNNDCVFSSVNKNFCNDDNKCEQNEENCSRRKQKRRGGVIVNILNTTPPS